jgi:molecular chaperone GrpE
MVDRDKNSPEGGETEETQGVDSPFSDETASDAGGVAMAPSHEDLMLELQDAQAKADEHWNQLLRARAEVANLQRRSERELENAHKYGLERFAKELLPVIDSLELGLQAASGNDTDPVKVREGLELTLNMLSSAVERFGLKAVDPQGERFDPQFHQAMSTQHAIDAAPNTVLTVYQKGYLLNDRLIRPAMVVVASADSGGTPDAGGDDGRSRIDELA